MRKWLKRIFLALAGLAMVLFLAVYFGGRWAVGHYLAREIAVGGGRVRLVEPRFFWSLDLGADSVFYSGPGIDVAVGATALSADLFRSLLRFSPAVRLTLDTVSLRLTPVDKPDTVKPRPDSIAFPDIRIPAAIAIRIGAVLVSDTGGAMARCEGVSLATDGPRGLRLEVREARARQTGALRQALSARASWDDTESVIVRATWRQAGDSLAVSARGPKANLLRAQASLLAHLAASEPYAEAFKLPPGLPRFDGLDADLKASMPGSFRVTADVKARVHGFPDSLPLRIGPQRMAIHFGFRDTAGSWSVESRGEGAGSAEDVKLGGGLRVMRGGAGDSLADVAWLARHMGVTAGGHVRGFAVTAAGKRGTADLEVFELRASGEAIRARLGTGDGSSITADLGKAVANPSRRASAARAKTIAKSGSKTSAGAKTTVKASAKPPGGALAEWNGTFAVDLAPGERWLVAFTDTNVAFKSARVRGKMVGGELTATLTATALKAYGVAADSLRLENRYGKGGYVMQPSHLFLNDIDWALSGRVGLDRPGRPMEIHLANATWGSIDAAMPSPDVMELRARNVAVEKLPYTWLDTLKIYQPRLTADFQWDKGKRKGKADLKASGVYKGEAVQAAVDADWDAQTLTVRDARAALSGNEILLSTMINLRGRQFYDLGKLAKEDFEEVGIGANRFDLAKALAVAMPDPPLKSGLATGRLVYSAPDGFSGTYRLENLHLQGDDEKISLKELTLNGAGGALVIKAVTQSASEPLFRDSISLSVTGVLGDTQTLVLNARAGQSIFLDFKGTVQQFKQLEGRLGVRGDVVLPSGSGELKNVRLGAQIVLPFKDGAKGLRLEADTLGGVYVVAGLDTQTFSAPVRMVGGKIAVPKLSMKGKGGAELSGRFEYDPASKRMSGSLAGNSLAAQFGKGDRIQLRNLKLDLRGDSTSLDLQATIGSGSAEHIKAPLRAAGDFSRVAVTYHAPMGKPSSVQNGASRIPFLRVDATLDSSDVRYRLRSMETLQNLFKRSPERPVKRSAKRSQAMELRINVETAGRGNGIETDILRVNYVGNFSMSGIYPYALVQGRISSQKGELGTKKQAYDIRRMDVKWLNTPLEEGKVELEATKRLARNCEAGTLDSCNITTRLTGELSSLQFTYDSDCEGASGAGVQVSALVYSVRRGCYSSALRGGGSGLSYEEQALGLLEPMASSYLSDAFGKLSGHWISSAQVSGLSALAADKKQTDSSATTTSSTQEAIALEILSKEFWRTRLRVKSAYAPGNNESSNPWNYRVGLEWRPPMPGFIADTKWEPRLKNRVNIEAAIFTDPDRTQENREDESLRKRLGLNYNYDFWGYWWAKKPADRPGAKAGGTGDAPAKAAGNAAAVPDSAQ
jgi:hypothetical protein